MPQRLDAILKKNYYDPSHPAGFGSAQNLLAAIKAKRRRNVTIADIERWLESQDAFTLHKKIVRKFPRRKTLSKGLHHIWQADLADMQAISKENRGMRYILTVIDVFSRYAWAIPIKSKKSECIIKAFDKIFRQSKVKPRFLQTDQGTEFLNKPFQKWLSARSIKHYFTYNTETKAAVVERWNRTLKTRMHKYFTAKNTLNYINVLGDLVCSYNNRKHQSLGLAPADVNKANEKKLWNHQYKAYLNKRKNKFKYKINDTVRITKFKQHFQKGYKRGWKREKFTIADRYSTTPPTYRLMDAHGELLLGSFYERELGRVSKK